MIVKRDELLPGGPDGSGQSDAALQVARSVVDEMT